MVKLANMLSRLNPAKILVIGDMFLDVYTLGKAKRISPEAPVAIVNVQHEENRPGGAGNVILNLLCLGAEVIAVGRVGRDWAGHTLVDVLREEKADTRMIIMQENYQTPLKKRIIVDHQQIVRIDHEQIIELDESSGQLIIDNLPHLMEGVKVVAISDYGKGFLTPTLLAAIMEEANRMGIAIVTDPKGDDFRKYKGTTVIKPNLSEAYAATGLPKSASLENVAAVALSQCQAQLLMVTRSEAGISLFSDEGERNDFPVHAKEVKDVTGAGDTVLAMLTYALANQLSYEEAAQLCNVAASIAIEHVGCARVTLSDLAHRLMEYHMIHKVFDQEHLFVLKEVLKRQSFNLLILSHIEQFTPLLFQSIKKLISDKEKLLVYLDDLEPADMLIEMLSSLADVSFIVLHLDSLKSLCQCVAPRGTYLLDGSKEVLTSVDKNHKIFAISVDSRF